MAACDSVKNTLAIRQKMIDSDGSGTDALLTDVSVAKISEKING